MGWFDEQIRERIKKDDNRFSEAFAELSSAVTGQAGFYDVEKNQLEKNKDAIRQILKYYHIKEMETEQKFRDIQEQLSYYLEPSGIIYREVVLEETWYQDGILPMLGKNHLGEPMAFIAKRTGGYMVRDSKSGKLVNVTAGMAAQIQKQAICFYQPLPPKEVSTKEFFSFLMKSISPTDIVIIGAATLLVMLLGLLLPLVNNLIFKQIIPSGKVGMMGPIFVILCCTILGSAVIDTVREIIKSRVLIKLKITAESAVMMRILSLPADFFKRYSAGELSERLNVTQKLCERLSHFFLSAVFSAIFSLVYVVQIFRLFPFLVLPTIFILLSQLLFTIIVMLLKMNLQKKYMPLAAKQRGLEFSLISGVQKLKLAGAEKRAISKWAHTYKEVARLRYNPPLFLKLHTVFSVAISLIGLAVLYCLSVKNQMDPAAYMTFYAAYSLVSAAFFSLSEAAWSFADVPSMMDMINPILKTVPEVSLEKKTCTRLTGAIELNNVCFRYQENMPFILNNVSTKIRPGQYIAVVGKTGCGKSTLFRLLLGLETPDRGAVYYDGKDLSSLNLKSLRQKMGVVLQDGKLFQGDIFSNIAISAPGLTIEEAWQAAELAGIAGDIKAMPMGMYTLISEGSGGISGGQRQRLIIARAIASKPRILLFDEATSALDNVTQKTVSDSLAKLKCTRIVIAHRLSTIQDCDRILVLENGVIAEDGSYEELIKKEGIFAALAERQRIKN
ncbi:ATP-binding cassette domain-containing protein [Aminipila butyrica]|uniref:ATP-binding cassette domain-containing protein n=1 Tax=Aminipila butyrica TaxID=433296 RepID=A0A858BW51_9FIRM|nr:ATP-binding cassette domain-containing protein [Aminipila butyrica]QIB69328.1 ATP-binding cassette domain-containing protein [Aminipila butyrica]